MYGLGTRSYNRSGEARQNKQAQKETTEKYLRGELKFGEVAILVCTCRSFRFPHDPSAHNQLLADYDWSLPEERRSREIFKERIR